MIRWMFFTKVCYFGFLCCFVLASAGDSGNNTASKNPFFKMTNTNKHLLWFVQVSDLHLSIFCDTSRIKEFREFCDSTIDVIRPIAVIASGDLTDGKSKNDIGTYQVKDEWVQYYNILKDNNMTQKTLWMDIRGNHDGFNIISLNSQENYFANYSIQGTDHTRSYMKQLHKDNNTYSFIALDSCLDPGHRRPFHFIGYLDELEISAVKNIVAQINATDSSFTIWFGHFPTSAVVAKMKGGVRRLIGEDSRSIAYLSGHYHTFGGIVPKMYTLHSEGFLELELGDWKDNRLYRLLAFDHGIFSFVDVRHKDWPIVLITNPKHALFVVPEKENLDTLKYSTHIRILVFSSSAIESVKVKINEGEWQLCKHIEGPLYVSQWNPDNYLEGLHNIYVNAKDINAREKYIAQPFSLDGRRMSFGFLAGVALQSDINTLCKATFGIMFVISVLPLSVLKCLNVLVRKGKLKKPRLKRGCCGQCLRKFWILTTMNQIFWPIWFYPIYVAIAPWSVGHVIEDYWGAFFTWGIFVNGAFLPGSVTYACAAIQLLVFHVPLTILLSNEIHRRFMNNSAHRVQNRYKTAFKYFYRYLPLLMLLIFQVFAACYFLLNFGAAAFLLGVVPTWSSAFAVFLWYKVLVLPAASIREATKIWSMKIEPEPNQNYASLPNTVRNADSAL